MSSKLKTGPHPPHGQLIISGQRHCLVKLLAYHEVEQGVPNPALQPPLCNRVWSVAHADKQQHA